MRGKEFLPPVLRVLICLSGMLAMGYLLYPAVMSGSPFDSGILLQALVLLGFAYLFVRSAGQLVKRSGK